MAEIPKHIPDIEHMMKRALKILADAKIEVYFKKVTIGHQFKSMTPTGDDYSWLLTVNLRLKYANAQTFNYWLPEEGNLEDCFMQEVEPELKRWIDHLPSYYFAPD